MQITPPDLYQYKSMSRYLVDYVATQQRTNHRFSIRGWAREMGMPSHTLLVMILQGKRRVSTKQIPFFARGLKLTPKDQLYLQALIQCENATTPDEKLAAERWLAEHSPHPASEFREIEQFWEISDWIHMAILEITALDNFKGTAADIKSRLRKKFTTQEIQSAIRSLRSFRLIEEVDGALRRTCVGVTSKSDVPNAGVRAYHKQAAELAKEAVDEQSFEEREFQSFAIAIASEKIPVAKKMIRDFKLQLCEVLKSAPRDQVYQFNMHFFSLTKKEDQ